MGRCPPLVVVVLLVLAGGPLPAGGGTGPASDRVGVRLEPAAPVQGDTLVVLVPAPPSARVIVSFDGAPIPVFPASPGLRRALVGTDPDTAPGAHRVGVQVDSRTGAFQISLPVRVAPGRFRVRHVTLPPRTFGLITPHNVALERRILTPLLERLTPTAWWRGPFQLPSTGPVDSPYGDQGVYNGHREWWHQGVDIEAPEGAPVAASNAGVVVLARQLPLGGATVLVDHGQGVVTEYLHLSQMTVREGQRVRRGSLIGWIGHTGLVTGPSLHWGLFVRGIPVNPLFWTTVHAGLTD